ncbi:4-coumarate--CoA ligase 1-like [Branchiostoma floridae]|uniref:Luciferin 4-monooxygenase n=1 Tax=Branchiostoma floridae TaxID=7739 RepID=A0A9J7MZP9_BRAFL|nr:4-coumarate--CoA ligase 1-like [Branchiostoma floridae]
MHPLLLRHWRPATFYVRRLQVSAFCTSTGSSRPSVSCLEKFLHASEVRHVATTRSRSFSSVKNPGILKSRFPDGNIPGNETLTQYVTQHFDDYGNDVAIINGVTGESYTYLQLKDLIRRFGSALTRLGFKQHDVLAVFSPNVPEYAIAFFGATSVGGVVTTANPTYTADELAHQLRHSNAHYVITVPEVAETVKAAKYKCPNVKEIFVIGSDVPECRSFSELLEDDGLAFPADVPVNVTEDVAVLPYSSGTTGLPKGVVLTNNNIVANLRQIIHKGMLEFNRHEDSLIAQLPFFHIYGMVAVLSCCLRQGVKIVTIPRFEPELYLRVIQDYKVNRVMMVPPIALFLSKHPLVDQYDLSHVKDLMCAAAPMGINLTMALRDRLNPQSLRQGYGLTETSPVTHLCMEDEFAPGAVGVIIPNTEIKVIHTETGVALGEGEDGEICVRGPQVMKGYLNNPEATAGCIDAEGWFHTGDIGHYDDKGYFYIVDRLKELIKYKGLQVAPADLEAVLLGHPGVQDVAVIGLPDDEAGEVPKAFIVKKTDDVTEQEIVDYVAGKVAPFKKLRGGVEFVKEIPKSASGKILRRTLRDKSRI